MAELLDLYTETRQKTGRAIERGMSLAPGDFHLCVHVWIRNAKGQLLIAQRAENRKNTPLKWECPGAM